MLLFTRDWLLPTGASPGCATMLLGLMIGAKVRQRGFLDHDHSPDVLQREHQPEHGRVSQALGSHFRGEERALLSLYTVGKIYAYNY